ncbi:MAG TPA: LLM class flavin-dependent oxidoreductase, partial [Terrimesophilobacter sp.]|nr:LLM class flavin-dependent oxidoreductase [Terrimesophilobacter sp.]
AMGGQRLTPGESIDALGEAIAIIRGVWDAENREPLRVNGTRYRVDGAKRGPAPSRDIPIVIGGYKSRMLRFIGTHADGWVPSFGYLKSGDIPKANAVIDQAAADAGREPAGIRRLLNVGGTFSATATADFNGPPDHWVRQLTQLAVDDGISTVILATDDADAMRRFAEEVIPAVRDGVARARRA